MIFDLRYLNPSSTNSTGEYAIKRNLINYDETPIDRLLENIFRK